MLIAQVKPSRFNLWFNGINFPPANSSAFPISLTAPVPEQKGFQVVS
jgi:hypothetical protein